MNAPRPLQRIAVLVSVGRHPVSGVARYSRNDAAALETGRQLAEQHRATLDVIHAGDPANSALAEYLALGAREVEVLACRDGDDAVHALAARVEGYDLVLTGTRAEGAYDTGMLPYRVAAALGYPLVGSAVDVTVEGGRAAVRQFCRKGYGGVSTRRCRPSSPSIRSRVSSRAMRMRGCAPARSGRRSRRPARTPTPPRGRSARPSVNP
ncbi:electron transfer flavoprotein subunit beta/FixA family protein (plasmid) [Burkholderia cenocepacia]|uniref:electron transfer flavoprotein subunit beta/FixA family protein n=1 Tax=Burkholderia cenocepacia TaxID=95486 RepID=UPI001F3EF545|nr:electron transfer flavoprotein subunit beta/FixA family protein [Burkholderia cenocepacia]UJH77044.1 electron transfer flavoprotein subunit beta/FixA family protein [Burkholderia cenocepacia]